MAEIVKAKERKNLVKIEQKEAKKQKEVKETKKESKKTEVKEDKNLWVKFRIFCHGVKSETSKVHWTSKENMVKYSIATIIFIIFCSLFFYGIDSLFAFFQSLAI